MYDYEDMLKRVLSHWGFITTDILVLLANFKVKLFKQHFDCGQPSSLEAHRLFVLGDWAFYSRGLGFKSLRENKSLKTQGKKLGRSQVTGLQIGVPA